MADAGRTRAAGGNTRRQFFAPEIGWIHFGFREKWRRNRLADLFHSRYSPGVERLAVLMMAPTSVMWAAAQIRAFGQVISASSELGFLVATAIAAAVVVVYTVYGGLRADAWTDVIQGIALMAGLVIHTGGVCGTPWRRISDAGEYPARKTESV